jgi:hypothetical protein
VVEPYKLVRGLEPSRYLLNLWRQSDMPIDVAPRGFDR